MERPCVNPACDATVTFELGEASAGSDQPTRHTAICAACACRQYLIPASAGAAEVQAAVRK
ncbi:MAG: hypothetical protein QOC92_984 [Acidimicrobiaceae bacterium]|jgi:hypothetical protein